MRKLYVLLMLTAITAFLPCSSQATEDNWRIAVTADDGLGGGFGVWMQLGVYPSATDGAHSVSTDDSEATYTLDVPQQGRWVAALIPGDARTWTRDIMSPASPVSYPRSIKSWEFRAGALSHATELPMRLVLETFNAGSLPPPMIGGLAVGYRLVMVDNKGRPGAPQNGKVWNLPIPTAHSSDPYWILPQADWFPILRLSAAADSAMISEGYQMRFEQYVVPEPAGISALGIGIAGLIGLAIRRRR